MASEFIEKWHAVSEEKRSNIVAGLDPALPAIGQGEKGMPEGADLKDWSLAYIDAVAPYVTMVKFNQAFFQDEGQRSVLKMLVAHVHGCGLLAMSDNKVADIGNTNNAWAYYNAQLGFDAMTAAPYAGNIEDTIGSIHTHGMGAVIMGLMSNPEYKTEMNYVHPDSGEPLWKSRTLCALSVGADGIVVGGTYTKNDPEFMEFVRVTSERDVLYLIPGIGAQGGTVEDFLASGIDPKRCMINSGRSVMFPNGSHATPEAQAAAARELRDAFNTVAQV